MVVNNNITSATRRTGILLFLFYFYFFWSCFMTNCTLFKGHQHRRWDSNAEEVCVWTVKLSCRIYSWCCPEPSRQGFWIRKGDILFSLSLILGLYRNSRCFPATKCPPMSTFLYWASHVKRVKFKAAAHGEGIQIHGKSAQYGIFYGEF